MTAHPAAPLLAQNLATGLPHTNAAGKRGLIHLPGFSATGMAPAQAQATGALGQAVAEAAIEALEQHGYHVVHSSDLGKTKAEPTAAKTNSSPPPSMEQAAPPPTIPARPQFISEQQRQAIRDQVGDQPVIYNREQSAALLTMLAANLKHILNDKKKFPYVNAEMNATQDGFDLQVRITAPDG